MEHAVERAIVDVPALGTIAHPDAVLEEREVERAFDAALASIPERHRLILAMRWHDGLAHEEIARVFGISRTRVRTIIARYQDRLRPFFDMLRANLSG
jgi:RNA polymerase sigma factor (sigma-70 family)